MRYLILIIAMALAGPYVLAQGKSGKNKGGGGNKGGSTNVKIAPGPGKVNKGTVQKNKGNNKINILPGKNKGNPGKLNQGPGKGGPGHSTTVYGHPNKNGNGKPQGMSGYEHGKRTSEYNKNKHKIPQTQGIALRELVNIRERTGILINLHTSKLSLLKDALERRRRLGTISDLEYRRKKASIGRLETRHKTLKKRLR